MGARDDLPQLARFASTRGVTRDSPELQAAWALDEIDRLRAEAEPFRCGECGGQLVSRCFDCNTLHGAAS